MTSRKPVATSTKPLIGPVNPSTVDVTLYEDIRYWANELGCTPNELRDAVKAAGNSVNAVRDYLAAHA